MIISVDAYKALNKIKHPFMIKKKKNSSESGHRQSIPPYNKGRIRQTHNDYHSPW